MNTWDDKHDHECRGQQQVAGTMNTRDDEHNHKCRGQQTPGTMTPTLVGPFFFYFISYSFFILILITPWL
jgi:hypothetical protein